MVTVSQMPLQRNQPMAILHRVTIGKEKFIIFYSSKYILEM